MAFDSETELRARLAHHRPQTHPLQHATAQFHLGALLLEGGRPEEAEEAFTTAAALFAARGARPEQAKALNGLGAALRTAGRLDLAERALRHAVSGLQEAGLRLEEGAARFNLGLVLREQGRLAPAADALSAADALIDGREAPGQASAVARELGSVRLLLGDVEGAVTASERAVDLADRAGDHVARAAAANGWGLALLAAGDAPAAARAFGVAAAASPRALRPDGFAMAKANRALAYEQAGDGPRARLDARQALSAAAPEPVREQARDSLERLGDGRHDLRAVFDAEDPADRPGLVREELLRVVDADAAQVAGAMREWLDVHVAAQIDPAEVAELWLGGLLELPPEALERFVEQTLVALSSADPGARETFREAVARAMVRFHVPQWMRLQDVFSSAAERVGDPGPWR